MPSQNEFEIREDDLIGREIKALLKEHIYWMEYTSPPESRHALDLDGLRSPHVTFWSIWQQNKLAGCGAIKELNDTHGEVKSMRTADAFLRRGVASFMLQHLVKEARRRGYRRLSLETGSMDYFKPARQLYQRFGFRPCEPFGSYQDDPNSVFMTIEL